MNTRYRYHPLYLALLWACQATAASQVPPGFESLLLGQTERLEVRLPGRSLGLFVVEVKPDTLTFEEPETVLAAAGLQTLSEQQQKQALQALSQPLARHGNLACNGSATPGCGYVATDSVAAILDESEGAVLLFMKPTWLASLKQDQRWLTPTPAAKKRLYSPSDRQLQRRQGQPEPGAERHRCAGAGRTPLSGRQLGLHLEPGARRQRQPFVVRQSLCASGHGQPLLPAGRPHGPAQPFQPVGR
ncbi:hypothetical protein [Serratia liquefaciens]|uniref:hypothetical protein n=1 Tax=Serratia liquefaciens TaxID=614 RepID=UPI000967F209|nr:hypothetical protein [Serratia liquefaciens]OKP21143.1 hypothetical protein BSQ35_13065 [Serratia liquefaciens]